MIKTAGEFLNETPATNQVWQTDSFHTKIIGWGWVYLSTILNDYSCYVIAWKLRTTMKADDVTDVLKLTLQASGCDEVAVQHKPLPLSDNGASYISEKLGKVA